jgi:gliding motility-associated-like protein
MKIAVINIFVLLLLICGFNVASAQYNNYIDRYPGNWNSVSKSKIYTDSGLYSIKDTQLPYGDVGFLRNYFCDNKGLLQIYFDGSNLRTANNDVIAGFKSNFKRKNSGTRSSRFLRYSNKHIKFIHVYYDTVISNYKSSRIDVQRLYMEVIDIKYDNGVWTASLLYKSNYEFTSYINLECSRLTKNRYAVALVFPNYTGSTCNVNLFEVGENFVNLKDSFKFAMDTFVLDTLKKMNIRGSRGECNGLFNHNGSQLIAFCSYLVPAPFTSGFFLQRYCETDLQNTFFSIAINIDPSTCKFTFSQLISLDNLICGDVVREFKRPRVFSSNNKFLYMQLASYGSSSDSSSILRMSHNNGIFSPTSTKFYTGYRNQYNISDSANLQNPFLNNYSILPKGNIHSDFTYKMSDSLNLFDAYWELTNPNETNTNLLNWNLRPLLGSNNLKSANFSIFFSNPYNYMQVAHEINYRCQEAKVLIKQFKTDSAAGMINFKYAITMEDGSIKNFNGKTVSLIYTKSGRYPYTCVGSGGGIYSELWEDTLVIDIPQLDSQMYKILPIIKTVSLTNNSTIRVLAQDEPKYGFYNIYRNGKWLAKTSSSRYDDVFTKDVDKSYSYQLSHEDDCGRISALCDISNSIFLKGEVQEDIKKLTFGHAFLNWNSYNYWKSGVSYYELMNSNDTKNWEFTYTGSDTQYLDYSFIKPNNSQNCYQIAAYNIEGDTSLSNSLCLPYKPIIHIPNAISSNGDGKNESWSIFQLGYKDFEIYIYNRWGQQIHFSKDASSAWKPDAEIPSGIYIYKIVARDSRNEVSQLSGVLHLLK